MSDNFGKTNKAVPVTKRSWYDCYRGLRDRSTERIVVTVSRRSLEPNFTCPVCLGLLRETMVTKDCVHRFCRDCIEMALSNGAKTCPSCPSKLTSMADLLPDPDFDALIALIFGTDERAEPNQPGPSGPNNKPRPASEGVFISAQAVRGGPTDKANKMAKPTSARSVSEANSEGSKELTEQEVHQRKLQILKNNLALVKAPIADFRKAVVLCPFRTMLLHRCMPREALTTRYFYTTEETATVEHVVRFLLTRIRLDCFNSKNPETRANVDKILWDRIGHCELFALVGRNHVSLDSQRRVTLREVIRKLRIRVRPVSLFFLFYDRDLYPDVSQAAKDLPPICPERPRSP